MSRIEDAKVLVMSSGPSFALRKYVFDQATSHVVSRSGAPIKPYGPGRIVVQYEKS